MKQLLHLSESDLTDGSSHYWAYLDNVLASKEYSRSPIKRHNFRILLNLQALLSKHSLISGICLMKNVHYQQLVYEEGYDLLLKEQILVPIFFADCIGFSETDKQDRSDSTSYKVKAEEQLGEFAQLLDSVCEAVSLVDERDFRDRLTERLERRFMDRAELRKVGLAPQCSQIRGFLEAQSRRLPNGVLRRSAAFFLEDAL